MRGRVPSLNERRNCEREMKDKIGDYSCWYLLKKKKSLK